MFTIWEFRDKTLKGKLSSKGSHDTTGLLAHQETARKGPKTKAQNLRRGRRGTGKRGGGLSLPSPKGGGSWQVPA